MSSNVEACLQGDAEWEVQPDECREPRHHLRAHSHACAKQRCHSSTQWHPLPEAGGGGAHQKWRQALLSTDQNFYRTAVESFFCAKDELLVINDVCVDSCRPNTRPRLYWLWTINLTSCLPIFVGGLLGADRPACTVPSLCSSNLAWGKDCVALWFCFLSAL